MRAKWPMPPASDSVYNSRRGALVRHDGYRFDELWCSAQVAGKHGGFPPGDSLNPLTTGSAVGNQTLTITSRSDAGGLVQGSWTGIVKVWYQRDSGFSSPKPGGSPAPAHSIRRDVDIYDKPGGHGKIIGMAKKDDAVTLNGPCPIQSQGDTNGWCLINDTTQNKGGAVWGDYVK